MSKKCSRCNRELPLGDFYRNARMSDGMAAWCKVCMKDYQSKYKSPHHHEVPRGIVSKQCITCGRNLPVEKFYKRPSHNDGLSSECKNCQHSRTTRNRIKRQDWNQEWRAKNIDKLRVMRRLDKAIVMGKIVKPTKCERCGKECSPHGHHDDYSKPFDVEWLCPMCHKKLHLELLASDNLNKKEAI